MPSVSGCVKSRIKKGGHRFENHAKGCVGCFVSVTVLGHGSVSVSEKGLNRLRNDTHERCGFDDLKPSMRESGKDFASFLLTR